MEKGKTNKKRIITIITAVIVLLAAAVLGGYYYLSNYASYTPEEYGKISVAVSDRYVILDNKKIKLQTPEISANILDVFCVDRGRIYFLYERQTTNTVNPHTWIIASTDLEGKNIVMYYKYFNAGEYNRLSLCTDYSQLKGGLYLDGKIYLKADDGIIVFDLQKEAVEEVEKMPECAYDLSSDEKAGTVYISQKKLKEKREISLDTVAAKNGNAAAVKQLGDAALHKIYCVNGEIYITGSVKGKFGQSYGVLFKYDFESDTYKYVNTKWLNSKDEGFLYFPVPVLSYFQKR